MNHVARVARCLRLALIGTLGLVPIGTKGGEVHDFYNVVAPAGADPWVVRDDDGRYLMTLTTGRDLVLFRSATLSGLGGGERKVVWTPPPAGPTSRDLWAPELHRIDGAWYLYFAADDGANANHRLYVLENPAPDPFRGAFRFKGRLDPPGVDRWAIDGTVFRAGGRLYLLWSGWEGTRDVRQDLYIAPMRNSWTLAGPRVMISKPTYPWETRGGPPAVNEGPQVLVRDGFVHVVYSASGSWTDHYCLGLLTARAGSDLLSPPSWRKRPEPVFRSGNGVFGPGHGSFTSSPDGTEDWIVYHAARDRGAGWARNVRAQRFGWGADGSPRFGLPAPADVPLALPSGEPRRQRYEAEAAALDGHARVERRPGASGGATVGPLDTPDSSVTFAVEAEAAGTYVLAARYSNGTPGKKTATQSVTVNAGPARTVRYEAGGRDVWSNAFLRVDLVAGTNQVRFGVGTGRAEVDCLDVLADRPGSSRRAPADPVP